MSYTKIGRASSTITKIARPISTKAARYGIGTFGKARYGVSSGETKVARPTSTITKIARPNL